MIEPQSIPALIVDDEVLSRELIRHMLGAHPDFQVIGECCDGTEALALINRCNPAVVFLDIQMPKLDGMNLLERLGGSPHPLFVFITAHEKYAIQAFEAQAFDYLLKPFDQDRFDQTIRRVRDRVRQLDEVSLGKSLRGLIAGQLGARTYVDRVVVRESGRIFFVPVAEIEWFEASRNYVTLHVAGTTHLIHETMANVEAKLDPARFVRIHRSAIINVDRIREMTPHFNGEYIIVLKDDTELKLSRSYVDKVKTMLGLDR